MGTGLRRAAWEGNPSFATLSPTAGPVPAGQGQGTRLAPCCVVLGPFLPGGGAELRWDYKEHLEQELFCFVV